MRAHLYSYSYSAVGCLSVGSVWAASSLATAGGCLVATTGSLTGYSLPSRRSSQEARSKLLSGRPVLIRCSRLRSR